MMNWYEGVMDTNLVYPRGVHQTEVIFDFWFADVSDAAREFNRASVDIANRVQDEDEGICRSVQRGLRSRAYDTGRLSVRREAGEHLFHRLLHADLRSGLRVVSEPAYSLYRLKRTPFHERVASLCLPQNFRRWAGCITVGSYDLGLDREYWAIRDAAALIDISPLMKYVIEGPDAARLLDRIMPRNIAKLAVGQVYYTGWCDDEGKLLDDGTITRLGEQSFRLTSAEPSLRWLAMNAVGMQVSDHRGDRPDGGAEPAGAEVPRDPEPLLRAVGRRAQVLPHGPEPLQGRPVTISRTGYTGDLGYEIWMDAGDALPVWDALMAAGADYGIVPCGILAMDMARVEAGLFMIDVDYTAANHAWIAGQKSSPYEMGLGWTVSLDKPGYFVGRRALEREHRDGSAWRLVGLEVDWEGLERLYAEVGLPPQIPAHGGPRQPAGVPRRQTDRLCLDQHLVAGAEEVHRTRAPRAPALRGRHAREHRGHRRASSPPGAGHGRRAAVLRTRVEEEVTAGHYDAIVIGAGHNGLIAAAYLSRAGKKVVVLERRDIVGGAAVTEEIFPGYRFTEFSYVVSLLRPEIIRDLELPRHGLKILPLPSTVTPIENGDYLAAWDDHDLTRRELYRHSPKDAEAADEYSRVMARAAKAIKPIISLVPPDPSSLSWRDLAGLLKLGRYGASLSEHERYRIAKLTTQSAGDLLDEWFELDPLKGTKSASGIIGTFLGPRSPGTAYVLLHHYMGEIDGAFRAWGFAKNGTGGVSAAIARSAAALGVEIRTGAPVAKCW